MSIECLYSLQAQGAPAELQSGEAQLARLAERDALLKDNSEHMQEPSLRLLLQQIITYYSSRRFIVLCIILLLINYNV